MSESDTPTNYIETLGLKYYGRKIMCFDQFPPAAHYPPPVRWRPARIDEENMREQVELFYKKLEKRGIDPVKFNEENNIRTIEEAAMYALTNTKDFVKYDGKEFVPKYAMRVDPPLPDDLTHMKGR